MSNRTEVLLFRQQHLQRQLNQALDVLQGSLHRNPSQRGYHPTTKVHQEAVTKYVRRELVPRVRAMTNNHLRVRKLLPRPSKANWPRLHAPPPY